MFQPPKQPAAAAQRSSQPHAQQSDDVDDLLNVLMNTVSLPQVPQRPQSPNQKQKRAQPASKKRQITISSVKSSKRSKQSSTILPIEVTNQAAVTTAEPIPTESAMMKKLAEAGMRRLALQQAIEVAGQLYDALHEPALRSCKVDSNLSVLRELCLRRIVLDKLTYELTTRNVLPVTLNTLSNLFARVCATIL